MILVLAATFLIYSNISVFFHFYAYLGTLPIDPRWYGILIAVFSAVPLVVRPVISPFLHTGNSYRFLYLGTLLLMASLALYTFATGARSMLAVRALHGFSFALAGAAIMTVIVEFIPKERSGQIFGLISVIVLIPNTLVPPLLPFLSRSLGGFTEVLLLFAADHRSRSPPDCKEPTGCAHRDRTEPTTAQRKGDRGGSEGPGGSLSPSFHAAPLQQPRPGFLFPGRIRAKHRDSGDRILSHPVDRR